MPGSDNGDDTINSEKLEELVKVQIDRLTRLRKELVNFKKDGADRRTRHHFKTRLNRIDGTRHEFVATHSEIIQLAIAAEDEYITDDIFDQFENCYVDVVAYIKTDYDKLYPETVASTNLPNPPSTSATNPSNVTVQVTPPSEIPFKMPQLPIPHFNGQYTEWPSFYDSFLQYHNHDQLTNNHKFQFLKGALSAKVKSLIGYLDITAENYDTAWNALIDRYNNKRVLFSNYMEKFLNQPTITNETADELQTLHDVSRACIFAIEKLDINAKECGVVFAHILIKKLPHSTRLEWEKQLGNQQKFQISTSKSTLSTSVHSKPCIQKNAPST